MRQGRIALWLVLVGVAGATYAQPPDPTPTPARAPEEKFLEPPPGEPGSTGGGAEITMERAKGEPPSKTSMEVTEAGAPPDLTRPSANAGVLRDLELVKLSAGEARVRLDGAVRTIKAGDVIGGDVVRRVEATRIVLARPEGEGHEAMVLVTFDARGHARVRVFSTVDPTSLDAPALR